MNNIYSNIKMSTLTAIVLLAGISTSEASFQDGDQGMGRQWGASAIPPMDFSDLREADYSLSLRAAERELAEAQELQQELYKLVLEDNVTEVDALRDAVASKVVAAETKTDEANARADALQEILDAERKQYAARVAALEAALADKQEELDHENAPVAHTGFGRFASYVVGTTAVQAAGSLMGHEYKDGKARTPSASPKTSEESGTSEGSDSGNES